MTSFVRVFVVVMFVVAAVAGQVTTIKNDIPSEQYYAAEKKAAELLKTANYRSVWTKEYFAERLGMAKLEEKKLREVIQPEKWRTVEETFLDKPLREEIISDGTAYYFRKNDGPWRKGGLGNGSGSGIFESGQIKNQFRYLPSVDFENGKADLYELVSVRTANKFSRNDFVTIRYIRTTRSWYSDGKMLRKIEETTIEGREEMLRETTTFEYDPKDLKIEAPIK